MAKHKEIVVKDIRGPRKLGPLTPLVGEWEGDVGVDLSYHNKDDETSETGYFEKAWFRPIPLHENGDQQLEGVTYQMTAWRHGEEAMVPFHDEVGYIMYDKANRQVIRTFAVPRGLAILAGATADPYDTRIDFTCTPGDPCYGLVQNKHLLERAEAKSLDAVFSFNDDGTFSYTSDLVLKLKATGEEMHHTDRNTLHLVKRYHPGSEFQ